MYQLQEARKWFTFFWIPLIPLSVLGEFVECQSCGSSYNHDVLTLPTAAQMMDNLSNAMRFAVVAIIAADGEVHHSEKSAALDIMARYSDTPYFASDLEADLRDLNTGSLEDEMRSVAGILNEHGKERLVTACVELAAADGSIDESEIKEIARAGRALGMSPAHIRGVISSIAVER